MARKVLAIVLLLALLAPAFWALAQGSRVDVYEDGTVVKSVAFVIGLKEYFVDGKTPGIKMDAAPFIEERTGRTVVPIRYLAYGLGVAEKDVGWEASARRVTLTKGATQARLTVGSKVMVVNGASRTMDVAPVLKASEGRTYLPARWVAEALGYQVDWEAADQLVVCWPKGAEKPDLTAIKEQLKSQTPQQPPDKPKDIYEAGWQIWQKARPFAGKAWDWSKYEILDGWTEEPFPVFSNETMVMEVTVDGFGANGIQMGQGHKGGYSAILDMKVSESENAVYLTHVGSNTFPETIYLLTQDNFVGHRQETFHCYDTNPYTHKYDFNRAIGENGLERVKLADVKAFLIGGGTRVLYVPNPVYKGGN